MARNCIANQSIDMTTQLMVGTQINCNFWFRIRQSFQLRSDRTSVFKLIYILCIDVVYYVISSTKFSIIIIIKTFEREVTLTLKKRTAILYYFIYFL